jgi:hypothetical protein
LAFGGESTLRVPTPDANSGHSGLRVSDHVVRREYAVVGREEVAVPAGNFRAWRLDFAQTGDAAAGLSQRGVVWLAEAVGLVRMIWTEPPGMPEQLLAGWGREMRMSR